ncbi:hypothetical protein HOE31_04785 [bacterium]|nr:hypothetical protein [bacterium]
MREKNTTKSKKWYKRWWAIVIYVFLFFIIMSIITPVEEKQLDNNELQVSNNNNAESEEIIDEPKSLEDIYSENERMNIYLELANSEKRAMDEAIARYPMTNQTGAEQLDRQLEYEKELNEEYKNQIMGKYNLSQDDYGRLGVEAYEKEWFLLYD